MLERQREQQDVELPLQQFVGENLRLRFAHVELEIGISIAQQRQQRRQQVRRDRRNNAETERAREKPVCVLRKGDEVAHVAQHPRTARRDLRSLGGELHARSRALDEDQAKVLLKLVDLHGERRLRDRAGVGCAAEMQFAGERIEVAQLLEGHRRHKAA